MTIIDRYYKNSKCNVFVFSIYLVLVEHVDKWITSTTAREKNGTTKAESQPKEGALALQNKDTARLYRL